MSKKSDFSKSPKVYILHENKEWILPLIESLDQQKTPYEEWFLDTGHIDLSSAPPEGIFYNRMSASSHTRGHRFAPELTGPVLAWLEAHARKVLNGRRALQLEVRKFEQYLSLQQYSIRTPKTVAAVGKSEIIEAAKRLNQFPFILKPNRGGKGLDVTLFNSLDGLQKTLDSVDIGDISLDGVVLIQEYIKPKNNRITRLEFIGGKFVYAVSVDTSGGFELCPADECQIKDLACPASPSADTNKFEILKNFFIPEIPLLEAFLNANNIDIGGIEYAESEDGLRYFYDVNTNTNYNREAEIRSGTGIFGMQKIAELLDQELKILKRDKSKYERSEALIGAV